jgi:hypothetical protein
MLPNSADLKGPEPLSQATMWPPEKLQPGHRVANFQKGFSESDKALQIYPRALDRKEEKCRQFCTVSTHECPGSLWPGGS